MAVTQQAVAQFFDDFVDDFRQLDGQLIAERYTAPYLSMSASGELQCLATRDEVLDYFHDLLNHYREKGCRYCRYLDLHIAAVSHDSVTASVTWELFGHQDELIASWRESYNMTHSDGQLKVFSSIDLSELSA